MCDSQAKYITWLCQRAKGRYSGQLEGEAGGMQQHSRLAQPNTHVCMKLECQHLIHAAGWWVWNKLCQRVAAAKIPLSCSRQRKLQQAVDSVLQSVMELFFFFFYGTNLKVLTSISSQKKKEWKYILRILCFQGIPGLQTVKWKLSNGSGCRKEDVMDLGNGVIIVIQDKDAYCHRRGVLWGANETTVGSERFLLESISFKCNLKWKHILQTVILPLLLLMFLPFFLPLTVFFDNLNRVSHVVVNPLGGTFVIFSYILLIKLTWLHFDSQHQMWFLRAGHDFHNAVTVTDIFSNMWCNTTLSRTWRDLFLFAPECKCWAGWDTVRQTTNRKASIKLQAPALSISTSSCHIWHLTPVNFFLVWSLK